MSAISEFAGRVKGYQDQIDAAVTGITGDLQVLNQKIADLQASQGTVTPEDQLLLDEIEARGKAAAEKLAALDALTPPPAP